jgi:hypothetical protein
MYFYQENLLWSRMDARHGPFDEFAIATALLTRLRDRRFGLGVSAGRRRDRRALRAGVCGR